MAFRFLAAGLLLAASCVSAFADEPKALPAASANATGPSAPAPEAAPKLSNFADLVFDGFVGENAPELSADFAAGLTLGTLPLQLEKTRLSDIEAAFGGQQHSQGDPANGATWLCYTQHARTKLDTPKTVWFIADDKTAAPGQTLTLIVVEDVDAGKVSGCLTAPKTFTWPAFGVPTIGATLPDIEAKLGPSPKDRQGNVYYTSTRPLSDGSGKSVYQTLGYVLNRKGAVLGLSLSQVTTD